MANLDLIRGRQVVVPLVNRTGGDVIAGDVVVLDPGNDEAFITTTTAREIRTVGVVQETIVSLGTGRVLISGYAPLVNVAAAVTRGDYAETHTVAKQATSSAARRSGSFGQWEKSGATPSAVLWGIPDGTTLSALGNLTAEEVDGAPTDTVTKIVFPNGSLGIAAHVATYTPSFVGIIEPVEFVIDGSGAVLATGIKGYLEIPFAWSNIVSARLLADQSGSVVVDVFKCTYAAFDPPTHPVAADKITASAPPTISAAKKSQDTTLTGWTKTGTLGDILAFNVNSATTIQRVTIALALVRA